MTTPTPHGFHRRSHRVALAARLALNLLPPADMADRIDYCDRTGEHGLRVFPQADTGFVEVHWGGRILASVPTDLLDSDEPITPPEMINETVPDTLPEEWAQ